MTSTQSVGKPLPSSGTSVAVLFFCLLLSSLTPVALFGQHRETGFLNRSLAGLEEEAPYQVYVPRQFDGEAAWPLIVYLHGLGPGGSDGMRQTAGGLAEAIRLFPDRFPTLVLFPQAPADSNWVGVTAERVIEQIDASITEFGVDPDRVYLSGASMGGEGVYYLAMRYPDRFAALVVSCGSPFTPAWRLQQLGLPAVDRSETAFLGVARLLRDIPLWAFHGSDDKVVKTAEARAMVQALRSTGSEPKFTEYPGLGHDACAKAVFEEELWPWLLSQTLSHSRKGG